MRTYFVFGGCLWSELEFPDLSPVPTADRPDWKFRIEYAPPPEPIELQGTRWVEPDWIFRLNRVENGLCLEYGATGSYGIYSRGREIVWYPGPGTGDPDVLHEMVRAIILGPVMALALQQSGILCLHGSAVTLGEEAVAFLGPKHYGKSTLALAMVAAGARLLSDDLVAIKPDASPVVLPGVHSVRVRKDIAERLGNRFSSARLNPGFKTTMTNFAPDNLAWKPARLAAIYLLEPGTDPAGDVPVSKEELPAIRAAAALAHGKKLTDGLTGPSDAGSTLEWIAAVTSVVPIHRLTVVRDLERLPDVVDEIMAWHRATTGARAR